MVDGFISLFYIAIVYNVQFTRSGYISVLATALWQFSSEYDGSSNLLWIFFFRLQLTFNIALSLASLKPMKYTYTHCIYFMFIIVICLMLCAQRRRRRWKTESSVSASWLVSSCRQWKILVVVYSVIWCDVRKSKTHTCIYACIDENKGGKTQMFGTNHVEKIYFKRNLNGRSIFCIAIFIRRYIVPICRYVSKFTLFLILQYVLFLLPGLLDVLHDKILLWTLIRNHSWLLNQMERAAHHFILSFNYLHKCEHWFVTRKIVQIQDI